MYISRVTEYFPDDMLWWKFKPEWKNNCDHSCFSQFQIVASSILWFVFWWASPFSSNAHCCSLYRRLINASYSLAGVSHSSAHILKRFYAISLPLCEADTIAKNWLLSDGNANIWEHYLASTFSVTTQCYLLCAATPGMPTTSESAWLVANELVVKSC